MGREAAEHPDKLVFSLMRQGFENTCYDGQYFFDADHQAADANGNPISISNNQGGSGPAWFLLDASRGMRPFVYQERRPFEFVSMTDPHDYEVFMKNEFLYGVTSRCNVGYGLWQLAYGSRQPLTSGNYAAARQSMQAIRGEGGRLLGIRPTTLVVPSSLEQAGRKLIKNQLMTAGESNEWFESVELIITPWLEA